MERVEVVDLAESFLDFCVNAYNDMSVNGGVRGMTGKIVVYRENSLERLNSNSQKVLDIVQDEIYGYLAKRTGICAIFFDEKMKILERSLQEISKKNL